MTACPKTFNGKTFEHKKDISLSFLKTKSFYDKKCGQQNIYKIKGAKRLLFVDILLS